MGRNAAQGATAAEVDAALQKGKAFLYAQQNKDGNWEPKPKGGDNRDWGGYTAIAVYALLASGESYQDARIARGIAFLEKEDLIGTYAIGLRCQIWNLVHMNPAVRAARDRDGNMLLKSVGQTGDDAGLYDYGGSVQRFPPRHNSPSQYGVLGMWALEQAGFEVPQKYWDLVDKVWRKNQANDGGWSYLPKPSAESPVKASMTAAGVATLFITNDYLHANDGINCKGNISNDNIEQGLKWMSKHFAEVGGDLYSLYGVERIGVASGYKYFGRTDWYAVGAETVVRSQGAEGAWNTFGSVAGTSFAMLFLSRGRAPVAFNKLDYETVGMVAAGQTAPRVRPHTPKTSINWNERPRDVANLVRWMGHQTERDLNWQIVNLAAPVEDFHDAPILYISGDAPPAITPEEELKLRQFVEEGGMILGNADCGKKPFADAFKALGTKLFPKYEFRELPPNHVIYTEEYKPAKWKSKPQVLGLSNGVRELMLLLPQADPARSWQTRAELTKKEMFELATDIYLYSIDKEHALVKGTTYFIADKGGPTDRTIKVVRLIAGDNPDPEPGGWRRLAAVLRNENKIALQVESAKPGEGKLAGAKIAHLTGTTAFTLNAAARKEIKAFVEKGGTLVVDAAGGSTDFGDAANTELAAIFGEGATALRSPLPPSHLVYNVPNSPIKAVAYRRFTAGTRVGKLTVPRLSGIAAGTRTGVFVSHEDLSSGLVGQHVDGIVGYDPASSTALMRGIILYADAGGVFAKPATQPATQPTTAPSTAPAVTQPTASPAPAPAPAPAPPAPAAAPAPAPAPAAAPEK